MNIIDLTAAIEAHDRWIRSNAAEGSRLNLSYADLSGANLSGANLRGANLREANLSEANLSEANLSDANLSDADLSDANLSGANLSDANLSGADLRGANLRAANLSGADLRRANLRRANLRGANPSHADLSYANLRGADLRGADLQGAMLECTKLPAFQIPDGDLIVWKKGLEGALIRLLIPARAKRTATLIGRKCRAEYAVVQEIIWPAHWLATKGGCYGWNGRPDVVYRVGETVRPDGYNDDPRVECTQGIHFFLTREEAEAW